MSAIAAPTTAPATLADRLVVRRSLWTDAALVIGGIAIVAGLAQVEVPMWPVPITGQTLGVVLVGAALGTRRATISLTGYMLLGLAGLPIFAGGGSGPLYVTQPSFGFIVGFIPAAALIGWLAERRWDRRPLLSLAGFLLASAVPFVVGVPYLAIVLSVLGLPHDLGTVMGLGVTPFLIGGAVKWLVAAAAVPLLWRLVGTAGRRRAEDSKPSLS